MLSKKSFIITSGLLTTGVIAAVALSSAYKSDRQYEVNRDSPTIASDIISTMSCYLSKLKVEDVLAASGNDNPPAYAAWLDVEACKSAGNVANDGSTVTPPSYEQLWVQPSRENDVIKIKLWGKTNTDGGTRNVYMAASIRGGSVAAPPFGDWDVDWCVERRADTTLHQLGDTCYRKGHIRVSPTAYQLFYDFSGSGQPYTIRSSGFVSADQLSGQGRYIELRNNNEALTTQGHFAFAAGALSDVTNDVASCKNPSRSAPGVLSTVWEGWLYDKDTGEKIRMNGGFPVQNIATKEAGWAGFDGVRLQGTGNAATEGTFKRVGAGADNTEYTAFGSYGKLIKITNESLTGLENIDGLVLRPRLVEDAFLTADGFTPRNSRQKVLMHWSQSEQKFIITHRDAGTAANEKFVALATPIKKSISEFLTLMIASQRNEYRIWAWQFGASNDFVIHLADLTNKTIPLASSDVKIYKLNQSQVTPGNGPTQALYCVGRCLDEVEVGTEDVPTIKADYDRLKTDVLDEPYTYDNVSGDFRKGNLAVDFTKVAKDWPSMSFDPLSPPNNAWMGMFVEESKLESMTCTVSNSNDSFCTYNRGLPTGSERNEYGGNGEEHIDTYYIWDTGTNRWNKFAGIKDPSGKTVEFTEPLILTYRAQDDAAFGSFRNKTATIRYPGEGRLWLPGSCKNVGDLSIQTSAACNNPDGTRSTHKGLERWVHEFVVPYEESDKGMVKGADGTEYLVKWTRKGTYYPSIDSAQCTPLASTLQSAALRVMPESSAWVNPMNPLSTNFVGPFDVNYKSEDPLYIHGVLKTN
jgi:hypothetical protein